MIAVRKRILGTAFVFVVLLIGFFILCTFLAKAHANPKDYSIYRPYLEYIDTILDDIETPLCGGDVKKAVQQELLPIYRSLSTGSVPGDKYTWSFEDALFYTEKPTRMLSENCMKNFTSFYAKDAYTSLNILGGYDIEIVPYDMRGIGCKTETREVETADGTEYRTAITEISVAEWCTPDGVSCSRQTALNYRDKCQKKISKIVAELIAARQANGKPLTLIQKLKWVHDWLVVNVEYDREKLKEHQINLPSYNLVNLSLFNEYGAIMNKRAVCLGYAYAFKLIVDEFARQTKAKIECELVCSKDHSWNRVKLNGQWYHVDVTWDDKDEWGTVDDTFFLVSDSALLASHDGGINGYYTYNPQKASDRKYNNKVWRVFYKTKLSGACKSIKKYKLGKKKAVRPFDVFLSPFASIYRYTKISSNSKIYKYSFLECGLDYTVKYKNNKKKGWATAIITFKGDFKGKLTIRFKITK